MRPTAALPRRRARRSHPRRGAQPARPPRRRGSQRRRAGPARGRRSPDRRGDKTRAAARGPRRRGPAQRAAAACASSTSLGEQTHELAGDAVYFTPGSAAIHVLDEATGVIRPPSTVDYVRYAKLVSRLPHIAAQSTALIPNEVPGEIADSWRLFLSLLLCEKPVVTGAFSAAGFAVMRDLQLAVRGTAEELREKPLCVFSCCPTAPLKWSYDTSQNVIDCARAGVPVEFVSMPLVGFRRPGDARGQRRPARGRDAVGRRARAAREPWRAGRLGRLAGRLRRAVRDDADGCDRDDDARLREQRGRQAAGPADAGLHRALGRQAARRAGRSRDRGWALCSRLSGINSISGPGMLAFESCQSLEKLVLDDEICGMVCAAAARHRAARGVPAAAALPGAAARGAAADRGAYPPPPRGRDPRALARDRPGAARALARRGRRDARRACGARGRAADRALGAFAARRGREARRSAREWGTRAARAGMPALPRVEA